MTEIDKFGYIINDDDILDFELSSRQQIDLQEISKKLIDIKGQHFIIDISINGFAQNDTFDFQLGDKKFSEIKHNFVKGELAQRDPKALTIKRAIRVCSNLTTRYIEKHNIVPNLKRFNKNIKNKYAHLGAHYIAPEEDWEEIIKMWSKFDEDKGTKIQSTIENIFKIRKARKV